MELIKADDRNSRSIFKHVTEEGVEELYIVKSAIVTELDPELTKTMVPSRVNNRFTTYETPYKMTKVSPATKSDLYAVTRTLEFDYETYEDYVEKVLPYVKHQPCEWIENIFEGSAEKDSVLFKNDEMVILPDIDWTLKTDTTQLNCLLICADNELMSIRDLTAEHIPLLNRMLKQAMKTVHETYGIEESHLKAYFHYHPSYWWLHVHIVHIDMNYGNDERNYALSTVIENLTIDPEYYQKVKLRIYARKWDFIKKPEEET